MADGQNTDSSHQKGLVVLDKFPGEDPLQHEGLAWLETSKPRLAAAQLLEVADGGDPPAAAKIIDIPLEELPALPPDHPEHQRRLESRLKI